MISEIEKRRNLNIFLRRKKAYNPSGRSQTEAEAIEIDSHLLNLLKNYNQRWDEYDAVPESVEEIAFRIWHLLK